MSLTEFVDRPSIKAAFSEHSARVVLPWRPRDMQMLAPSCGRRHGFVGTAFDYMARFRIARELANTMPEGAVIHNTGWIAEASVEIIKDHKQYHLAYPWWSKTIGAARKLYWEYADGEDISIERVARCVQFLAAADMLYRTDEFNPNTVSDNSVTRELLALNEVFHPDHLFSIRKDCLLNPNFQAGGLVGGADADIIVDGLLVDIKTTISPGLNSSHIRQLAGYAVLQDMAGIRISEDKVHTVPIREVALYFSRQGLMARWQLDEIFPNRGFAHFSKACQDEMYNPAPKLA